MVRVIPIAMPRTMVDTIGDLLDLTWTFAPTADQPATPPAIDLAAVFAWPDAAKEHLARLRERVRIGHVRGIETEIRAIEAVVGTDCAMISRLYGCLDRFDLSGLARLLEHTGMLEHNP